MEHFTTDKYPLTIQEFREWLKGKNEDEIVGKARHIYNCPISLVLQEKIQNKESFVGVDTTYVPISEINTLDYTNPQWVISFIHHLDGKYKTSDVTAKQALEVLEEIL